MVNPVTSFSTSGLRDWLIQRITAVILGIYFITLILFFVIHPRADYSALHALFYNPYFEFISFFALLSLVAHAWIGVWTIFTDYIKPTALRLLLEILMVLILIIYAAWGIRVIWL